MGDACNASFNAGDIMLDAPDCTGNALLYASFNTGHTLLHAVNQTSGPLANAFFQFQEQVLGGMSMAAA